MSNNKMLIDGKWVGSGNGATIEIEDPATSEIFDTVPAASDADIDAAVAAADAAFPAWSRMTPEARGEYLHKGAALAVERADEIGRLMTREQGKPFNEARGEVLKGAEILRYYAEEGKRTYGRIVPCSGADATTTSFVTYEPVGVSAGISPWNYPIELVAWKVGGALAAGCTFVAKPPSLTPLSPLRFLACLVDAGIPRGVVNVLFGAGSHAGTRLIRHPLVKKVAFTGSTEVGRQVMRQCAESMTKVSLELGGQCALIVSDKCRVADAVSGAVRRSFRNMGQICIAINRIYVQEKIYREFLDGVVAKTRALVIANGLEKPDADIGPMANREGREKTMRHIADAVGKGAHVACGGKVPDGPAFMKGYFFQPTVLTDVTHEMLVMHEETFGPVVGIMPYRTLDEAIGFANSTAYGLATYAYTEDLGEADELSARLQSGNVAINNPDAGVINAPYGGFKESGMGYEHGPEGLEQYLRAKHVRIRFSNRTRSR
ncbi:MAG: NAD-dependent succinate-semialdehyde dehydrogenase [Spirochaetia bacterium]|jgi:succinate-semialdehyde dehydrogenase/glutarate-semialdehyde dehydrogenase